MQELGGNPKGIVGRLAGALMNAGHERIYRLALESNIIKEYADALDIGCGGGKWLNILSKKTGGRVCGIDHSEEMTTMAKRVNRHAKNVEVMKACVTQLPYGNDSFDIVTAYETIQFWPDISKGLGEIIRVLRQGGKIVIINRFPEEGSKWADFLKLSTAADYKEALQIAGFRDAHANAGPMPGWITAMGEK
jgi:ubiquinone/menaquinone biosynthesis C-methylase UbiE